ncbi:MAG: RNA pseudouridine synthase [Tenericutes bacterium HGW-Tenericutes-4]|nr:MAG: RNA pseudouridine synthase [Tenericutes bacterium HGW-Tenericutes-4]
MLNIVYEDNHIIVVVKPQNVPTQEDSSKDKDLFTLVKDYIKETYEKPGNVYLGLVHRLDRPTGGLMIFAKSSKAASRLSENIREGEIEKSYLACVLGQPKDKRATLINYLKKDEQNNIVKIAPQGEEGSKRAELVYNVLEQNDHFSLLNVKLLTGRSHQIRVQLAYIKHPIFGDVKYKGNLVKGTKMALWAYQLKFVHPVTKQVLSFVSFPPSEEVPWKFFNLEKHIGIKAS